MRINPALCPVEDMRLGEHRCFVFDTDSDQRDVATAYVRAGLAWGEKVFYFTDASPTESLVSRLSAGLPVRDGQLTVRSADDSYLAGGVFDPDRMLALLREAVAASAAEGFSGYRVTGEMSWSLRGVPGSERLVEYERAVQSIFDEGAAMGLCQYDRRLFGDDLDPFLDAHTGQVEPAPDYSDQLVRITRTAAPRGLRLTGEVDLSNHEALLDALTGRASSDDDVHVDMAALTFVDIQGARALVRAAATLTGERRLVLHYPPAGLRRALEVTGWSEAPHLHLAD